MADTKDVKAKIEKQVSNTAKKAVKWQLGKHTETNSAGETITKRGFYKDTTSKGEGLKYEKGRGIVADASSKVLMKPFNKIEESVSEADGDAGQEINAKNRNAIKYIFKENIAPAISSSRIGFDRKQGNYARQKIKLHDQEQKDYIDDKREASQKRVESKEKSIDQYRKLEQNAKDNNINFKGKEDYVDRKNQEIEKEKKEDKKEAKKDKKEYKKDKKKYQKKAYKDNGLKKFSVGGVLKSGIKGYMPEIEVLEYGKKIMSALSGVFKIIGIIGSGFSFIINLLLMGGLPIILIIIVVGSIGIFFKIDLDTNRYLETTKITSKYESLIKDYANEYFNAPLLNKFGNWTNYDEIVLDTQIPNYKYEQNKLAAFLEAYLGDSVNGLEGFFVRPQEHMCEHYFNSCFRIQKKYETVEYTEQTRVWDSITQQYQYQDEKKTKVVLHLDWVQEKSLDDWIEEQWDKDNPYYDDYDSDLAREQYKQYLDPKGINQILSSPFEEGTSTVTSQYGCRINPVKDKQDNSSYFDCSHSGVDFAAKDGTPLHAVYDDGVVQDIKWHDGGGNILSVLYNVGDEQYLVRYMHLSKINVSVGDTVNKSDIIAYSGNTGEWTTGPHLHLEVYLGDKVNSSKQINPLFIVAN